MKEPHIEDYLADLEENLLRAVEFLENSTFEDFEKDYRTQYAVIRALEIIGESVKRFNSLSALPFTFGWPVPMESA